MWGLWRQPVLPRSATSGLRRQRRSQSETALRGRRADLRRASAGVAGQAPRRERGISPRDLSEAVEQSEAVFIAVGTPQGDSGAADLSYVEAVVAEIARSINELQSDRGKEHGSGLHQRLDPARAAPARRGSGTISTWFRIPEFLREGTAIVDFLHPDRIVVGANNERSAEVLRRIYEPLTGGSYYAQPGALPGPLQRDEAGAAAGDFNAERGDHQARVECISGDEDFVHQRGGQPGRGRGCGHRRHCRRHGPRQPHRTEVSARGTGIRRLVLSQGRGRIPLGGAGARRRISSLLEEVRKINDTQQEVFFNKVRSALVDAARQAAGGTGPGVQRRHGRHSRVAGDRDDSRSCCRRAPLSRPTIRRRWSAQRKCCRPPRT